jgi:hypothetical protein
LKGYHGVRTIWISDISDTFDYNSKIKIVRLVLGGGESGGTAIWVEKKGYDVLYLILEKIKNNNYKEVQRY